MGSRTHVGITDKHGNVQFVYGHWQAPLHRAGADILMGELDNEKYSIEDIMIRPLSEFGPDLSIECAYLLPLNGEWLYAETNMAWQVLTKEDVNKSFLAELRCYKNIATGKSFNACGQHVSCNPDYWRFYDSLQIRQHEFNESDVSPLTSFGSLHYVETA